MDSLLQWELDWIDQNMWRYDSQLHQDAVKENIKKRYRINELNRKNEALQADLDKLHDELEEFIDCG